MLVELLEGFEGDEGGWLFAVGMAQGSATVGASQENRTPNRSDHPRRDVYWLPEKSRRMTMSPEQNVEIVRRGYEAFGRGDLDTLLSLFDENIEWTTPGPPELPTAGTRRGPQQVAEFFRLLDDVFEIQRFDPKTFISEGDRVVVLGDDTSRIKATGKVLDAQWAHVFTLKDGKVVSFLEYIDTAAVVAELRSAQVQA
jgi:ketosteroid isomerase-like protein